MEQSSQDDLAEKVGCPCHPDAGLLLDDNTSDLVCAECGLVVVEKDEPFEPSIACPSHPDDRLIVDLEAGNLLVCPTCGLVVTEGTEAIKLYEALTERQDVDFQSASVSNIARNCDAMRDTDGIREDTPSMVQREVKSAPQVGPKSHSVTTRPRIIHNKYATRKEAGYRTHTRPVPSNNADNNMNCSTTQRYVNMPSTRSDASCISCATINEVEEHRRTDQSGKSNITVQVLREKQSSLVTKEAKHLCSERGDSNVSSSKSTTRQMLRSESNSFEINASIKVEPEIAIHSIQRHGEMLNSGRINTDVRQLLPGTTQHLQRPDRSEQNNKAEMTSEEASSTKQKPRSPSVSEDAHTPPAKKKLRKTATKDRNVVAEKQDKGDSLVLPVFDDISERLHIDSDVIDKAKEIYIKTRNRRHFCQNIQLLAAACVCLACRQEGFPCTFHDLSSYLEVSKAAIGRMFKLLVKTLGTSPGVMLQADFVRRFSSLLELSEADQTCAFFVSERIEKLNIKVLGTKEAAVGVYIVANARKNSSGDKLVSFTDLEKITGIKSHGLRDLYRLVFHNRNQLFPKGGKYGSLLGNLPLPQ